MFFLLICLTLLIFLFFFFNDTATTEIYTLSLHDALPISHAVKKGEKPTCQPTDSCPRNGNAGSRRSTRSEEHTSELQSQSNLVCRLLLEKKKKKKTIRQLKIMKSTPNNTYLDDKNVNRRD